LAFVPLAMLIGLAASALMLPSCAWDGHFCVLGYSTKPNYRTDIRSVRVQIFKNKSFWTVTPVVGMEQDLARAITRAIEQKTPYKVKHDADTELSGNILNLTKGALNVNQFNYPLEVETVLSCEVLWTDLRTGEVLSKQPRRFGEARVPDPRQPVLAVPDINPRTGRPSNTPPISTPTLPNDASADNDSFNPRADIEPDPEEELKKKRPIPLTLRSIAQFRPSLGESITTALNANYARLADEIVNAMEIGW
jgi:hypothetical protein